MRLILLVILFRPETKYLCICSGMRVVPLSCHEASFSEKQVYKGQTGLLELRTMLSR